MLELNAVFISMYSQVFCERLHTFFVLGIACMSVLNQAVNDWPHLAFDAFAAQHAFRRKVVEICILLHFRERLVLLVG